MTKNLFSFITIIFLIGSCSTSKNKIDAETQALNGLTNRAHLFSMIKRSYCFGTCPVYELKIYANGDATYHGIKNVELKGFYSGQVSKKNRAILSQKAKDINYMEMKDVYDNPGISDLPSTTTSIVINGSLKEVRRRYGYPTELIAFEKLFDEIIASTNWDKLSNIEKK
jgi:hypothetical protein